MCLTCWRKARPMMNPRMAWRNVQGVTYQMHQPEPSEHESASPFQSLKPKRVGLWCPSLVVNWWVERTWWAQVCAVQSLNSCPASSWISYYEAKTLPLVIWLLTRLGTWSSCSVVYIETSIWSRLHHSFKGGLKKEKSDACAWNAQVRDMNNSSNKVSH